MRTCRKPSWQCRYLLGRAKLSPGFAAVGPGTLSRDRGLAAGQNRAQFRPAGMKLRHWLFGLSFLLVAVLVGVLVGPVPLAPAKVVEVLVSKLLFVHISSGLPAVDRAIIWQVRAPRVALGGLVGATLAMAGASYQSVFRNPLADPYLLGIAAGAGLGATVAFSGFGTGAIAPSDTVPLFAFGGGLLAVSATYLLGRSGPLGRNATTLVLAGVAVGSLLTAIQTYLQQRSTEVLAQVYSWILGSLATASWSQVAIVGPYVLAAAVVLLAHRRLLDVMALGDEEALALGVQAARVRAVVVAAATLGTAAVVAVSGLIGFVGIIVPHAVRLVFGSSYRVVLPLSMLFGAGFLVLADLAARTLLSPDEIPIGVVTALIGAPFFLAVLRTARRMY